MFIKLKSQTNCRDDRSHSWWTLCMMGFLKMAACSLFGKTGIGVVKFSYNKDVFTTASLCPQY